MAEDRVHRKDEDIRKRPSPGELTTRDAGPRESDEAEELKRKGKKVEGESEGRQAA